MCAHQFMQRCMMEDAVGIGAEECEDHVIGKGTLHKMVHRGAEADIADRIEPVEGDGCLRPLQSIAVIDREESDSSRGAVKRFSCNLDGTNQPSQLLLRVVVGNDAESQGCHLMVDTIGPVFI